MKKLITRRQENQYTVKAYAACTCTCNCQRCSDDVVGATTREMSLTIATVNSTSNFTYYYY